MLTCDAVQLSRRDLMVVVFHQKSPKVVQKKVALDIRAEMVSNWQTDCSPLIR